MKTGLKDSKLTGYLPPARFQFEHMLCLEENPAIDQKQTDWDWGYKFYISGYKADLSDLKNESKAYQVRASTPVARKKPNQLTLAYLTQRPDETPSTIWE